MRIMILDDDARLRGSLQERLKLEGFEVHGAGTALEFYRGLASDGYDIAVVDVGLPDEDGLNVVSWLRRRGGMGIVVLTGRGDVRDRIDGFRSGADLYFVKPVESDELVQGIHSLARRVVDGTRRIAAPPATSQWFFEPGQWTLLAPDGQLIKLTATEMRFIQRLLMQPGKATSREALRTELRYNHDKAGDQNLDALVRRLRRKIGELTGRPAPIQTVHGQGYLFSAPLRLERRSAGNR